MKLWRIVLKSLRQHSLSTGFAVLNIALGVSLLIAVVSLREQAHENLTQVNVGVDAILGPKGSPLTVVLNGLYHMDEMPGKIKWTYYKKVLADPIVQEGIPFCTGHSYAGFRVDAIDRRFLTDFEYLPGEPGKPGGKSFPSAPKTAGRDGPLARARRPSRGGPSQRSWASNSVRPSIPSAACRPGRSTRTTSSSWASWRRQARRTTGRSISR